jgi:hypothetical protein
MQTLHEGILSLEVNGMNLDAQLEEIERIFRNAMFCHKCFEQNLVKSSLIDIPQPRWIGPNYISQKVKIALILLNPGAGNIPEKQEANKLFRQVLYKFKDGIIGLRELFHYERQHIPKWGTPSGRFKQFYLTGLGLELNNIALANIAWCSNAHNKWPRQMLDQCFQLHTIKLLNILDTSVVILSGSATHHYESEIKHALPRCSVVKLMHYAHRKGHQKEQAELQRVKDEIAAYGVPMKFPIMAFPSK